MIKSKNLNYAEKLWLNLLNRKINNKEKNILRDYCSLSNGKELILRHITSLDEYKKKLY